MQENDVCEWAEAEEAEACADVLTVPEEADGERLDRFLVTYGRRDGEAVSRSLAVKLIEKGSVTVEGLSDDRVDKNTRLKAGDCVTVSYPEPEDWTVLAENIPLDIIFEDNDILVVNKPSGMVVHPAPGHTRGTLVNALMYHCGDRLSGVGGVRRPGIVHRIDKDTSGLLVVAKHDAAHAGLAAQIARHDVSRVYEAICLGNVKADAGTVDLCIGRHGTDRKRMATYRTADGNGRVREAVTHYHVLDRFPLGGRYGQSFTHLRCELETGRTHQIRVHMASLGHPLLGDTVYGGGGSKLERVHSAYIHGQCLHAKELHLTHPMTGEVMHFACPLPTEFSKLLEILEREVTV